MASARLKELRQIYKASFTHNLAFLGKKLGPPDNDEFFAAADQLSLKIVQELNAARDRHDWDAYDRLAVAKTRLDFWSGARRDAIIDALANAPDVAAAQAALAAATATLQHTRDDFDAQTTDEALTSLDDLAKKLGLSG